MGSLLNSFIALQRTHYWVSGEQPARIEACSRFFFPTLHEAASVFDAGSPQDDTEHHCFCGTKFFAFPSHCQDCIEQRADLIQTLCPGNGTHIGARSCSPAVAPILRVSIAIVSPYQIYDLLMAVLNVCLSLLALTIFLT